MASRISVEVTGNSTELQVAVERAAASLKDLSGVVSRTTGEATKAGAQTTRSNERTARSYETTGAAARSSGLAVVESSRTQMAAVRDQAAQNARAAAEQRRAYDTTARSAAGASRTEAAAARSAAGAQDSAAARTVAASGRRAKAFGDEGAVTTRWGRAIAAGLVGVGAASVYMAAKYQASTERLRTQAGATQQQVEQLRAGMLRLAPVVAETPAALSEGMYHVVSSMNAVLPPTTRVKEELQILKVAAQGAQIGGSSLEETSYALASAMNALHQRGSQARQTMGELNAIVGAGDMTMTDLLDALKSGLIPAAETFGVSLRSVGAALAVMGDMGIRGALAGTRLRMSLALLGAPSEKAAKLLQTIGMSSHQAMAQSSAMSDALAKAGLRTTTLSADLRRPDGLQVALQDLNRHLEASGLSAEASGALISHAFGGGRSGAAIMLMAQNTDRLGIKFRQIGDMSGRFGHDWQATTHTLSFELKQVEATLEATGIAIGTWLIPKVETAIGDFRDMEHWLAQNRVAAAALGAVVVTVGGTLIAGYLTAKVRQATVALREFGAMLGLTGASRAAAGGGAARALGGAGSIVGARGALGAGSIANPVVVAIEAGQYAGLSSVGAAGTVATEQKAAAAESGAAAAAARGAPIAGGAATEAEALAAGGIGATLSRTLGTVVSGALKGGMVAIIGELAAHTAGSIIGGHAGKTVSSLGSAASIGAGVGAAAGPWGMVGGAIAGVVAAEIKRALSEHDRYGIPGGSTGFDQVVHQAAASRASVLPGVQIHGPAATALNTISTAQSFANPISAPFAFGKALGIPGLSQAHDFLGGLPVIGGLFGGGGSDPLAKLRAFADKAPKQLALDVKVNNAAAINALIVKAQQLEREFPRAQKGLDAFRRTAAQKLNTAEVDKFRNSFNIALDPDHIAAFGGAINALNYAVKRNTDQIARDLKGSPVAAARASATNIHMAIDQVRTLMRQGVVSTAAGNKEIAQLTSQLGTQLDSQWKGIARTIDHNSGDAATKLKGHLGEMAAATDKGITQAIGDVKRLMAEGLVSTQHGGEQIKRLVGDLASNSASTWRAIAAEMGRDASKGAADASGAISALVSTTKNLMSQGDVTVSQGMKIIGDAFTKEAEAFGINPKDAAAMSNAKVFQLQHGQSSITHGNARGGYIGAPGERGRDTVGLALRPGTPILSGHQQAALGLVPTVAGRGEYVGSLDEVPALDARARERGYAGLPGLFASVRRPHYMAQGGTVGNYGAMVAEASAITSHHYPYLWGGGHDASFSGPYDCSGAVSAVLHAGGDLAAPMVAQQFMSWGLPGPGLVSIYASPGHVYMSLGGRFFGTSNANPGGGADWFAGAPRAGFAVRHAPVGNMQLIPVPKVAGPDGLYKQILQGSLTSADKIANKALLSAMVSQGQVGGGNAGEFGATSLGPAHWAGKVSTFGPPGEAAGQTASGVSDAAPGIALRSSSTLGQQFRVGVGGRSGVLPQIDWGPAASTGRVMDVTGAGAAQIGINPASFPTDSFGTADLIGAPTGGADQTQGAVKGGPHSRHARGGLVHAASGAHLRLPHPPKTTRAPKVPRPRVGSDTRRLAPHKVKFVAADDPLIAQYLNAQTQVSYLQGHIPALQAYLEAMSPDGALPSREVDAVAAPMRQVLGFLQRELRIGPRILARLGATEAGAQATVDRDQLKLRDNSDREARIRRELQLLAKPTASDVPKLDRLIHDTRVRYEKLKAGVGSGATPADRLALDAARSRLAAIPADKRTRGVRRALHATIAQLEGKVSGEDADRRAKRGIINADEIAAVGDLTGERLALKTKESTRRHRVALERWHLRTRLLDLTHDDSRIRAGLAQAQKVAGGDGISIDDLKANLQTLPDQILTEQGDIRNLVKSTRPSADAAAAVDDSQLVALLEQQNVQLSQQVALGRAQTYALESMLPQIPQYRRGGPVLDDGPAILHAREHVVPEGGSLVLRGDQPPAEVHVHQHFHGRAGELMRMMDQRIAAPGNVRVVSHALGVRYSQLRGAPGGGRR